MATFASRVRTAPWAILAAASFPAIFADSVPVKSAAEVVSLTCNGLIYVVLEVANNVGGSVG